MGDNITPPQQAFNWIADLYASTEEIKANGQTIVGLIHEDVGHLGIFVSGKVAKKEHTQIFEVLKCDPGAAAGPVRHGDPRGDRRATARSSTTSRSHERSLEDLKKLQKYDRVDEKPFEAVAALSELTERAYELLVRPAIRDAVPEWLARVMREWHPLRAQRWMLSDRNPLLAGVPAAAAMARAWRQPRTPDNAAPRREARLVRRSRASLDLYRDLRDAAYEATFFQVYGNLMSLQMADQRAAIRRQTRFDPRALPAVRQVLDDTRPRRAARGGRAQRPPGREGRRRQAPARADRERARAARAVAACSRDLTEDDLRRVLHDETIVVEFEPAQAKRTLPRLVDLAGRPPQAQPAVRRARGRPASQRQAARAGRRAAGARARCARRARPEIGQDAAEQTPVTERRCSCPTMPAAREGRSSPRCATSRRAVALRR